MQRDIPPELAARLRGAAETFAEVGFEQARIDELSAVTGVPSSTIYYYLTGKEGLLAFLLTDWLNKVAESVTELERDRGNRTPAQRLVAIIQAQLRLMGEHPATCRVLLAENGRIGRLPQIAAAVNAAFHQPVEKVLHDGMSDGSLRVVDPEGIAAAIYGASTIGGLHYLITARTIPDEFAETLTDLILNGIAR